MRVECEKLSEREATPELIRELVRDGTRRVSSREVEAKGKFKPAEGGFTMDRGKVCKDY